VGNFSALFWPEQVTFWQDDDNDDICFVLDQQVDLDFYCSETIVVAPFGHIILIPSQPVFDLTA
jgi:hypothetical protein